MQPGIDGLVFFGSELIPSKTCLTYVQTQVVLWPPRCRSSILRAFLQWQSNQMVSSLLFVIFLRMTTECLYLTDRPRKRQKFIEERTWYGWNSQFLQVGKNLNSRNLKANINCPLSCWENYTLKRLADVKFNFWEDKIDALLSASFAVTDANEVSTTTISQEDSEVKQLVTPLIITLCAIISAGNPNTNNKDSVWLRWLCYNGGQHGDGVHPGCQW